MEHETLLETVRHSGRVASLCLMLGAKAGNVDLLMLHICALLHDVGKQSLPESLIGAPRKLTPAEFECVKTHAKLGAEQIQAMVATLEQAADTALQHHERYGDGKGYLGLMGEEIQPMARIVSLCDVVDALMSRRPYKEPLKLEDTLEYVREHAGTQFDPYWAEILLSCEDDLREFYSEERNDTQ